MSYGDWHKAGPVTDFAEGVPVEHCLMGNPVAIVKLDDEFHAFRNECPHQGAPLCAGRFAGTMLPSDPDELEYGLRDQVIRCPWHGWEFHVPSSKAVFGISNRRLLKYDTEVRDDDLYVRVPDLTRRRVVNQREQERV